MANTALTPTHHVKGTGFKALNDVALLHGNQEFSDRVIGEIPELAAIVKSKVPASWVDMNIKNLDIWLQKLGDKLYPDITDKSARIEKLGEEMLEVSFPKFYKILFNFTSTKFAFKNVGSMWKLQVDKGVMSMVDEGPKAVTIELRDYLKSSTIHSQYRGIFRKLGTMAGAKNIKVDVDLKTPEVYKWKISWD